MRVFILGAGFSKPAGFPLTIELTGILLDRINEELPDHEPLIAVESMLRARAWAFRDEPSGDRRVDAEELFFIIEQMAEAARASQHFCSVGRSYGSTPWGRAEDLDHLLEVLEEALLDTLFECESKARLEPIERFATHLREDDVVLTFNYDLLLERALDRLGRPWTLGFEDDPNESRGTTVRKLHGSIDWLRFPRGIKGPNENLHRLFSKTDRNVDGTEHQAIGESEYDEELFRIPDQEVLHRCVGSAVSRCLVQPGYWSGLAGLGHLKRVSRIAGLGRQWSRGLASLAVADQVFVIGFGMVPYDRGAFLNFCMTLHSRIESGSPPPSCIIVSPKASADLERFRCVFPGATPVDSKHECVDWQTLLQ